MPGRHQDKPARSLTLACVNFRTQWGNKAANLEKMKQTVIQAAKMGNEMIVFPELALSGYECDPGFTMQQQAAEPIPGPAPEEMAKLAAEQDVYIIFGLPERDRENSKAR